MSAMPIPGGMPLALSKPVKEKLPAARKVVPENSNAFEKKKPVFIENLVGPVYDKEGLEPCQKSTKSFRLPMVIPTSHIERLKEGHVPEIRKRIWENPSKPPKLTYPKIVHLIDCLDDNFDNALEELFSSAQVGLKLHGKKIGRKGELYTIAFSTWDQVFIFDVTKLQDKCFKYGLKAILQDPNIQKVCHDVRCMSDILKYQYNVDLTNVFDTILADFAFNNFSIREEGTRPMYLRSYQSLCVEYLGIGTDDLFYHPTRTNHLEEDAALFWRGPITNQMVKAIAREVMYLLPLHDVCQKALIYHFRMANLIFLDQVRGCSNSEEAETLAKKIEAEPHRVPQTVMDIFSGPPECAYCQKETGDTRKRTPKQDYLGNYLPIRIARL
eukprot:TRINITY_DN4324_c1_g2_i5.p1 TRINITY_DN4324_c1_g2~~TRINITY_DN4324_c1_g2_i5.p1  ORF type:complete len:384 (-),score=57.40 TRINITY_DN4324_c1_g2_i5:368-1519(-)